MIRQFIFTVLSLLTALGFSNAQTVNLDHDFATAGIHIFAQDTMNDMATAVAQFPDGRLLMAGHYETVAGKNWIVVCFHSNGTIDSTFGVNGRTIIPFLTSSTAGYIGNCEDMLVQSDGKIVLCGLANNGTTNVCSIVRLLSTGVLDSTFATAGIGHYPGVFTFNSMALQTDGKLMVSDGYWGILRINTDGSLDSSFVKQAAPSDMSCCIHKISKIGIMPDGRTISLKNVYSEASIMYSSTDHLGAYLDNGNLDTSFMGGGEYQWNQGNTFMITSANKIVVAGLESYYYSSGPPPTHHHYAKTFNANGTLDSSFVSNELNMGVACVNEDAASKIVCTGAASNDFALIRLNADGSPDLGFGTTGDGMVKTDLGGIETITRSLIQPDGKIVVVGNTNVFGTKDMVIARYHTNAVGINSHDKNEPNMYIYPNPAQQQINVRHNGLKSVILVDMYGNVVKTENSNNTAVITLNIETLPAGVYSIVGTGLLVPQTQKFIKY